MIDQQKTLWPIAHLFHWNRNPRTITPEDKERLKQQVIDLGQYKPLIITSDGEVLGGNMRLDIYKELGFTEAWVSIVVAETDADKVKYALSDNDRAGTYDEEQLAKLIQDLGVDINLEDYKVDLGDAMTLSQVLEQIRNEREITEDEAPPVSQDPAISLLGEVYQLGRHRLMCGDSTKIEDVERLMDGQKADMVFTDPPYGYSYESNHQDKHKELINDDKFLDFIPTAFIVTQENAAFYVFCGWQTVKQWVDIVAKNALDIKNIIIWKKNNWSMGDLHGAYAGQYEMIIFAHKGRVELQGERDRDVWEFDRVPPKEHPTMKPIGLIAKAITKHLSNIVLDLFGGSGSTLIAAEQTNRTCYMMELDPKYCDVIRKRYAKFIGGEDEWETITPKL